MTLLQQDPANQKRHSTVRCSNKPRSLQGVALSASSFKRQRGRVEVPQAQTTLEPHEKSPDGSDHTGSQCPEPWPPAQELPASARDARCPTRPCSLTGQAPPTKCSRPRRSRPGGEGAQSHRSRARARGGIPAYNEREQKRPAAAVDNSGRDVTATSLTVTDATSTTTLQNLLLANYI